MKNLLYSTVLILSCIAPLVLSAQSPEPAFSASAVCLSPVEQELARLINEYRAKHGLSPVKISVSLTYVAQVHCHDLFGNTNRSAPCNLHSWTDKGKWTSCCYTPDHKKSECMWSKPRELTNYQGDGYEIAYFTTGMPESPEVNAREILEAWKASPGHNGLIMNEGIWKTIDWNAMGVGVYNGYATVWFGKEADPAGIPDICD